jgi:FeS assembly SUF system regulator
LIRLTNLADYAVVVMTAAARAPNARLSAARVAELTTIPVPTVAKLMGTLARAGLLTASRGVAGGFSLAAAPESISVAAIVEAVDGPIALTNCLTGESHDCAIGGHCTVRGHWAPINEAVRAALAAVTLADLLQPAGAPTTTFALGATTTRPVALGATTTRLAPGATPDEVTA